MNRRTLLKSGLTVAGGSLLASPVNARELTQDTLKKDTLASAVPARRKLGTLEVFSVGLGVQNMSRTYQTTVPSRTEMISLIRSAYDRGVTLFDTAEAYGPFDCERILGEAAAPFRKKVVITSFTGNDDRFSGK